MTPRPEEDRPGRAALSQQNLIIAELFERYIQRANAARGRTHTACRSSTRAG
jgi:hypothetical protein